MKSPTTAEPSLDWPQPGQAAEFRARVETHVKAKEIRRAKTIRRSAGAAALVAFLFWAVPTYRSTSTIEIPSAHRSTQSLADGSTVNFNAGTKVKTDFRYGRRIVELTQGEAFFSVAKDAKHPFLVKTPAGLVRVTGTQFNVRLADTNHLEVTLLEGGVTLNGTTTLKPGEQFQGNAVRTLSATDLDNVTLWRSGQFAFDGLTLAEAAQRISFYHGIRLDVAPAIAALQPGGTFALDDLPALLRALESVLSVRAIPQPDGSCRLVAR